MSELAVKHKQTLVMMADRYRREAEDARRSEGDTLSPATLSTWLTEQADAVTSALDALAPLPSETNPERITEAELRRAEIGNVWGPVVPCSGCGQKLRTRVDQSQIAHDCDGHKRTIIMTDLGPTREERLVDEVRRLRGLIVAADADPLREDNAGKPQGPLYDALMACKTARWTLAAEAEAIRAEAKPLRDPADKS